MTRFGVDAPTFLRLARDDRPPHPAHQLVAPSSLRSQALELLLHEVRAGQITDDEALRVHERMTRLKVRLLGDRVSRRVAWEHARRTDSTELSRAEYLAVTQLQADVLLTSDPHLRAMASEVVPLAGFDDLFTLERAGPEQSAS